MARLVVGLFRLLFVFVVCYSVIDNVMKVPSRWLDDYS